MESHTWTGRPIWQRSFSFVFSGTWVVTRLEKLEPGTRWDLAGWNRPGTRDWGAVYQNQIPRYKKGRTGTNWVFPPPGTRTRLYPSRGTTLLEMKASERQVFTGVSTNVSDEALCNETEGWNDGGGGEGRRVNGWYGEVHGSSLGVGKERLETAARWRRVARGNGDGGRGGWWGEGGPWRSVFRCLLMQWGRQKK